MIRTRRIEFGRWRRRLEKKTLTIGLRDDNKFDVQSILRRTYENKKLFHCFSTSLGPKTDFNNVTHLASSQIRENKRRANFLFSLHRAISQYVNGSREKPYKKLELPISKTVFFLIFFFVDALAFVCSICGEGGGFNGEEKKVRYSFVNVNVKVATTTTKRKSVLTGTHKRAFDGAATENFP